MPLKIGGVWNYRVMRYQDGALGVHEVFYTDGQPTSCTENPIGAVGDDLEELRCELEAMLRGLDAEILDYEAIAHPAKPEGE